MADDPLVAMDEMNRIRAERRYGKNKLAPKQDDKPLPPGPLPKAGTQDA